MSRCCRLREGSAISASRAAVAVGPPWGRLEHPDLLGQTAGLAGESIDISRPLSWNTVRFSVGHTGGATL